MNTYDYILDKIHDLKTQYPSLRSRTDDYIFSVLCVKNHFYKNQAQFFNESDFDEIIVDSCADSGADILLSDPNSENFDLVIGQSKSYQNITKEIVLMRCSKWRRFTRI